jgi:hypothetical protein
LQPANGLDIFNEELATSALGGQLMNVDLNSSAPGALPPVEYIRLRKRLFGNTVGSGYMQVDANSPSRFAIQWEDEKLGLKVVLREEEDGRLMADVFCNNAELLGKSVVSVALIGKTPDPRISKSVPLDLPAPAGCRGTADFGLFSEAVYKLGDQLAMIAFLNVDEGERVRVVWSR